MRARETRHGRRLRRLHRLVGVGAVLGAALTAAPVAAAAAAPAPPAERLGVALAPETAGLTPGLAIAYTLAARDARAAGVPLRINSGRRSRAQQQALWDEALAVHGSAAAARRWVLPPGESTHVTGEAIDVAPAAGAAWLERHGARYGLCRTFDNEWWHFERTTVPGRACPPRWADAAQRQRR